MDTGTFPSSGPGGKSMNLELPGLWLCGDTRAELIAPASYPDPGEPLWSWDSGGAPDLPDERRGWFRAMDEVKPAALESGQAVVLVTSSTGGAAVISRADRKLLFSAPCQNAHSIELLPGGLLAVAGSVGTDELQLWRLRDGPGATEPVAAAPMLHAHSAVWDPKRDCLWASGADKVAIFQVEGSPAAPKLAEARSIQLPERGAHDMMPDGSGRDLLLSTGRRCWKLDTSTCELAPYGPLESIPNVKAISELIERQSELMERQSELIDRPVVAFQKGECGNWWSENIYILFPDGRLQMRTRPGRRIYKVRWDQLCRLNQE